MEKKKYYRHSGYLGGLKEISLKELFAKNPAQVLKLAVQRMMPRNKLSHQQIKRLKFE
jgi:large subunit ribosomal protein L13